jgi:hypothetical protein
VAILLWYDQYFSIRSRGAEPKWLSKLRHRLLACVIAVNVCFLVLSVVNNRFREAGRVLHIVYLAIWAIFILPLLAGHSLMVVRLNKKLEIYRASGKIKRPQDYLDRVTKVIYMIFHWDYFFIFIYIFYFSFGGCFVLAFRFVWFWGRCMWGSFLPFCPAR